MVPLVLQHLETILKAASLEFNQDRMIQSRKRVVIMAQNNQLEVIVSKQIKRRSKV